MAWTRATKERRLASLEADIETARTAAGRHRARANRADARAAELVRERDWLREAPVADPLPETYVETAESDVEAADPDWTDGGVGR